MKAVPVYWLGKTVGNDTGAGMRLYRTFIGIKGRPAEEAVRVMTMQKPDDPDYESPWAGAKISSVTRSSDGVTVDFKALPREKLEPDLADLAMQQLVYTVQGALGDDTVPSRSLNRADPVPRCSAWTLRQPPGRAQRTTYRPWSRSSPEQRAVVSDR